MKMSPSIIKRLSRVIENPNLENARELESALRGENCKTKIFSRLNQKASIEAAAESDRGITERISNAFDASLTSARLLSGYLRSDPSSSSRIKERVVQDVVLDCYQHLFRLDDLPDMVNYIVVEQPSEDISRASENCLNFDKILRVATMESKQNIHV